MREIGRVVSVRGNRLAVSVKRTAACERCGKCSHAHIAFGNNDDIIVEAIPLGPVQTGELVELEMEGRDYVKLSFIIYIVPLLSGFVGFGLGWFLGGLLRSPALWGTILGLAGLALAFFWVRQYDKGAQETGRYLPLARPIRDI